MVVERLEQSLRPAAGLFASLVDFYVGRDIGADQPRPHGSLMVRRVPFENAAFIARPIARVFGRQASQSKRSEQLTMDYFHDLTLLLRRKHAVEQADRKDLVGAYGRIAMLTIDYVVQAASIRVPKLRVEAAFRVFGQ